MTRPLEEVSGAIGSAGPTVAPIEALCARPDWWAVLPERPDLWLVVSDPDRNRWGVWRRISKTHAQRFPEDFLGIHAAAQFARSLP